MTQYDEEDKMQNTLHDADKIAKARLSPGKLSEYYHFRLQVTKSGDDMARAVAALRGWLWTNTYAI